MNSNIEELNLFLLRALATEWLRDRTPVQVGSDPDCIRILRQFASVSTVEECNLDAMVRELYEEVFLRSYSSLREAVRLELLSSNSTIN